MRLRILLRIPFASRRQPTDTRIIDVSTSLSLHAGKRKWKSTFQNSGHGIQMVQFEFPWVIYPLMSSTFGIHCGAQDSTFYAAACRKREVLHKSW